MYADYDFYTAGYHGDTLTAENADKWLSRASDELDSLTFGRLSFAFPEKDTHAVKVKKAVCAVAEVLCSVDLHRKALLPQKGEDGAMRGPVTSLSSGQESVFVDFEALPADDYEEAFQAAAHFIDCGRDWQDSPKKSPRVMDWEQDKSILFPAINKAAGLEVRTVPYMHWWTFMGYYMEISEGVFSTILSLRQKRAKGKKLEKWEQEFWQQNKDICVLKKRLSQEEIEERDRLNALLG